MLRANKSLLGQVTLDEGKKQEGRGAYICKSDTCIQKATKTQSLNRAFKKPINKEIYEKLKTMEANIEQGTNTTKR